MTDVSLDSLDADTFRALAHRCLDDALDWMADFDGRPAWQPVPDAVAQHFQGALPEDGIGEEAVYTEVLENIRPYVAGNVHPRWWGYVTGAGTRFGALAELLTGTLNSLGIGGNQASTWVELQVLDWAKDMLGFPKSSTGVLVTGASVASLVALAVATRDRHPDHPPVVYASSEVHYAMGKALRLLGLGASALRAVAVNERYELDPEKLAEAVAADRAAGLSPTAVIASTGTVNTGAFDPIPEIADFCDQQKLWLHLDAAIGAPLRYSDKLAPLMRGVERADSVAFDYHKWLNVPFSAGAVLIRDGEAHADVFAAKGAYVTQLERGLSAGPVVWRDLSPDLSRPFWALKIWMMLKATGTATYGLVFEKNVAQAQAMAALVEAAPQLEFLAPVPLNIVCFRYVVPGLDDDALDAFNAQLLMDVQESGVCVLTHTHLDGRFALRACIVNHRTRDEDVDVAVREVLRLGDARR